MKIEKDGCVFTAKYPAPWVFVGKLVGHYPASMAPDFIGAGNRAVNQSRVAGRTAHIFGDFSDVTTYDTKCRQEMTEWSKGHRGEPPIAQHYILVRSSLVAMGASTAAMLLGGSFLKIFSSRDRFEQAIEKAADDWGKELTTVTPLRK